MAANRNQHRESRPPLAGVREAPFALAAPASDGLTLDGWGAVFGRETVIDSWEGRFREQIALGAMKKSFREKPPKIQFDHGHHPLFGSLPIAKLERVAEEVDPQFAPAGGAHIIGRIMDNWLTTPIRDALAAGTVDGMSFRFEVVREAWHDHQGRALEGGALLRELERTFDGAPDDELPVRTLQELKVPEMGPVVWPAYSDTSVMARSTIIDLCRLHEPEQRKLLATAMFLADTAEQDNVPRPTVADQPVGEHTLDSDDAPQPTGDKPAGEHTSKPLVKPRGSRAMDLVLRNQRDTLLSLSGVPHGTQRDTNVGRAPRRAHPYPPTKREAVGGNPRPHGGNRRTG